MDRTRPGAICEQPADSSSDAVSRSSAAPLGIAPSAAPFMKPHTGRGPNRLACESISGEGRGANAFFPNALFSPQYGGARKMKAIAKTKPAFGAEIVDVPVNKPGPGELLVKVAACGICGSDLHIYEWELGADRMVARLPAVIGHEPAGEVVEVGAGVTTFKA